MIRPACAPARRRPALLVAALVLCPRPALAQLVSGSLEGTVTEDPGGAPVPGVTVTATGPALAGEQTSFTDSRGRYRLADLPPGTDYVVRCYYGKAVVERGGIQVYADRTLAVPMRLPAAAIAPQLVRITERSPAIDVGSPNNAVTIDSNLARRIPLRGRTYEALLALAPGATTDPVGWVLGGGTGPENAFLIDGVPVGNPAYGLMGTHLSLELVKETEVLLGGYGAEYGRALGGVVNVVTRSGSNEFHGDLWLHYAPFSLDPQATTRIGEAISTVRRGGSGPTALDAFDHGLDFGFQLGGPIARDRVWFELGFAPSFFTQRYDRSIVARVATTADEAAAGGARGETVPCPAWLSRQDAALCEPAALGAYRTVAAGAEYQRSLRSESRLYNYFARLDVRLADDHRLTLSYLGSPSTFQGVYANPRNPVSFPIGFNATPDLLPYRDDVSVHDASLRYLGRFADRRLQLEVRAGYHGEHNAPQPDAAGAAGAAVIDQRASPLGRYEDVAPCRPTSVDGVPFDPCPVQGYQYGGFGALSELSSSRLVLGASLTAFLQAAGTHAIKAGAEVEQLGYDNHQWFSGGALGGRFFVRPNGAVQRRQYGALDDAGGVLVLASDDPARSGFTARSAARNYAVYLRDAYSPAFLPGLTVQAGLRWEGQQLLDGAGRARITILDNLAPRVGFAWDFTRRGRSRLHASWGRFYESIPVDLADRQFGGAGLLIQSLPPRAVASACPVDAGGRIDAARCRYPAPTSDQLVGGDPGQVAPGLKGQFVDEITAGLQYDVGWEVVLGAAYIHRSLGRILDDIAPDGVTFIVANPGDPGGSAADYPRPVRDYNALQLTASRRFTDRFALLASYTYSRTLGNYPGLYSPNPGQLDPNTSIQYDLKELLQNASGPLPQDRPHHLKVTATVEIPLGAAGQLLAALHFGAISGAPIDLLGAHPIYGPGQTYILPRGSGGRTPTVTQLDLRIGWARALGGSLRAEVTADVFNVLDQREVTQVNMQYTADDVRPIPNGGYKDLAGLKTTDGSAPHLDPSFGQPVAWQAPLSLRLGARLTF